VATVVASIAIAGSTAGPTYNIKQLKGSITADGSSSVGPYTTSAAELFRRAGATNVRVPVGISGTGGGFERFCKGETDLSDASRPMRIREAQICKDNNIGSWRACTVANDALTVVSGEIHIDARRYHEVMRELPLVECCTPISGPALSPAEAAELEQLFKALADRHRLQILNCLLHAGDEAVCVCDFQPLLGVKQPTVSHHLKQLVDAGLLEREKRGTYAYYRLRLGAIERIGDLLATPAIASAA
jgi:ArsR family transcriptional regulator